MRLTKPLVVALTVATFFMMACRPQATTTPNDGKSAKPPAKPSGSMKLAFSQAPGSLDFMASTQGNVHEKTAAIVESLFEPDNNWAPQPMLVSKTAVNADQTEYTFTLRDVRFHNGKNLTGDDVVASLQRWIQVNETNASRMKSLTSMTAPSKNTVRMKFSKPEPQLELFLSDKTAGIIPGDLARAAGKGVLPPKSLVGTGPYMFDSYKPGVSLVVKRYPGYKPVDTPPSGWAGAKHAYVNTLEFDFVSDPEARLAGLQTGEYQWADSLPDDKLPTVKADANLKAVPRPIGTSVAYFSSKSRLVADPAVRHAILVGLNMREIGQSFGPQDLWKLSPALTMSNSTFASNVGTEEWNKADVTAAKSMLAKTNYHGQTMRIIASANTSESVSAAVVLKQQMGAMGIPVKVETLQSAALQDKRARADGWELAIGTMNASAGIAQQTAVACGNTVGGYCSAKMTALLDRFFHASGKEAQQAANDKIQALAYKDLPFIKLPETKHLDVASSKVAGYVVTNMPQPAFWNIWIRS